MVIDVTTVPDGGLDLDSHLTIDEASADGLRVPEGIRLAGRLEPGPRGFRLQGRVEARVRQDCSRCLEPFDLDLGVDFSLVLVQDPVEPEVAEKQLSAAETAVFVTEGGRLDLVEVAREQIYLELPLKAVCGKDCAGLCPTCGANRNRIECVCRRDEIDPRLAPLSALKPERENRDLRGDQPEDASGKNHGEPEA